MKAHYDFTKGAVIKGMINSKSQVDRAVEDQNKILNSIRRDSELGQGLKELAPKMDFGYLNPSNNKLRDNVPLITS